MKRSSFVDEVTVGNTVTEMLAVEPSEVWVWVVTGTQKVVVKVEVSRT